MLPHQYAAPGYVNFESAQQQPMMPPPPPSSPHSHCSSSSSDTITDGISEPDMSSQLTEVDPRKAHRYPGPQGPPFYLRIVFPDL